MVKLSPTDVLSRSRAQIVALPDHRLLVRHAGGLSVLSGPSIAELRRIVELADGRRVEELLRTAAEGGDPGAVRRQIAGLVGDVLERRPAGVRPADGPPALTLVGNGAAAERVAESLGSRCGPGVRRLTIASFAGQLAADEERVLLPGGAPPTAAGGLRAVSAADLATRLRGAGLVVCVLEGVPWRILWDVQQACRGSGVPALFVTLDPDGVRVGPAVVGDGTPCLACAQAAGFAALGPCDGLFDAIAHFRTEHLRPATGELLAAAQARLRREAGELLADGGRPGLAASVALYTPEGGARTYEVPRHPQCPLCRGPAPAPGSGLAARVERALIDRFEAGPRQAGPRQAGPRQAGPRQAGPRQAGPRQAPVAGRPGAGDPDRVRRVGIVGGGTAGYLAALGLRARLPDLAVTLIESSAVPVIGVGEATTPLMPQFLHADLGLDVHELFREVRPTLKLGIRFEWDGAGSHFNYPFGPVRVLEPFVYDGDVRRCSLRSMTMSAGVLPVAADGRGALDTATAYHLDNRRFVHYLRRKAGELGVETIDATIADVELDDGGGEVRRLVAEDGRRFAFDLYLDCSGFRSLLLERGLGSPFVSFRPSLRTDRALIATVPHGGRIAPYTLAEAMDAGWCWSTPQRDADHRGYVYCSDFLSPQAAEEEMRRKNPGMGEARTISFRAGRHQHFWKGNVVALGNAYGFVEPLESTALHLLIRQIGLLLRAFPLRRREPGLAAFYNRKVNDFWDYLRFFLAVHYRFNRGRDTPFWRHCRERTDVSSHGELLEAYADRGPLSYDPRLSFDYPDPLWGAEGLDVLLLGQRVPARLPAPARGRAEWLEHVGRCERAVASWATQERVLAVLDERPEILERFAAAFRAVGPAYPVTAR